jgi:23S rRNA pseudouridine1911/1915/1917 synthase
VSPASYRLRVVAPGGRLDRILARDLPELSRSQWQRLIQEGCVLVDGDVVDKPAFGLSGGEHIRAEVPPPKPSRLTPEDVPLDILYEDEHTLAINKPPGMVVHPGPGHHEGTLVHAVLNYAPSLRGVGGVRRPGVVHRLDKGTSGVILMAKDDAAHRWLQRQFRQRTVHKLYLALVDGRPPTPSGRIEAPIGRDPKHRKRMAVVESGRPAGTTYHTRRQFAEHAYLEVEPATGRTHQVRVHLAFVGVPVVGARTYGRRTPSMPVERPLLHAAAISFVPLGEETQIHVQAPVPEDFAEALRRLGGSPGGSGQEA